MDEKFNRIPVSVIHLDKDGTVIDVKDYNLDKVEPDLWAIMKRFPFSNPVTPVSKMGTSHL